MKFFSILLTLAVASLASPVPDAVDKRQTTYTSGLDVNQLSTPSWGIPFIGVVTTIGLAVSNPVWASMKASTLASGSLYGGIHIPTPPATAAGNQALYFTANGGNWAPSSHLLPGTLWLEKNPKFPQCYNMTQPEWLNYIKLFVTTYKTKNGRYPIIATSYDWWKACTYGYSGFSSYGIPLWIINPGGSSPTSLGLPIGWTTWTIWQAAVSSPTPYAPYNKDLFNGASSALIAFAG